MNEQDAVHQAGRIHKFRELEERAKQIRIAIDLIKGPGSPAPGPFTSNHREYRRVNSLYVEFSQTRRGAPQVRIELHYLKIEAWKLGEFLKTDLEEQLKTITEEMEKI